ncbi:unnamed protein product, partial [Iphiclides podalirius]
MKDSNASRDTGGGSRGSVIEGLPEARGGLRRCGGGGGAGGGVRREQEYSKRENAARPACRDFTYLTRNLYRRVPPKGDPIPHGLEPQLALSGVAVIAQNIRGQYFSSLGTAGIGPDTIDECARPLSAHSEAADSRSHYSSSGMLPGVLCRKIATTAALRVGLRHSCGSST